MAALSVMSSASTWNVSGIPLDQIGYFFGIADRSDDGIAPPARARLCVDN
jgi:hypothetical protein